MTDFAKAKEQAKETHKYILLSFSGSDWCIPCIRTKKEIFDKEVFQHFADSGLILVNADFPRLKKNMPNKVLTEQNENLANQYNKDGVFPLTLLLDANGHVVKKWVGYPDVTPEVFISQIIASEQTTK